MKTASQAYPFEHKAPYSKDGRKQLCVRCGKYSGRSLRFCPHCEKAGVYDNIKIEPSAR